MDINWQTRKLDQWQANTVCDYLRKHRNGEPWAQSRWSPVILGPPNHDFVTITQVKELTHVDIASNERVRELLKRTPQIEWSEEEGMRFKVRCLSLSLPPPRHRG